MAWYDNIPGIAWPTDAQTQDIHDKVLAGDLSYGHFYYVSDYVDVMEIDPLLGGQFERVQAVKAGTRPASDLAVVMITAENGPDAGTKKAMQWSYSDPDLDPEGNGMGIRRNVERSGGLWVASYFQGNWPGPLAPPSGLAATAVDADSATIEWTNGEPAADAETWVWLQSVGHPVRAAILPIATEIYEFEDLEPGVPYKALVAHHRNGQLSSVSEVVFTTDDVAEDLGIDPPTDLVIIARSSSHAAFSWTPGDLDADTVVMLGSQLVAFYPAGTPLSDVYVYGLLPSAYTIRIWHVKNGLKSAELTDTLPEEITPPTGDPPDGAPTDFSILSRTDSMAHFGWVPGDVADGVTTVISVNGVPVEVLTDPEQNYYVLLGLDEVTVYVIQIWHVRNGQASARLTATVTTLATDPEDEPEVPDTPGTPSTGTTGNDIIEMAYARLRDVSPDHIATEAVELLSILQMAMMGLYQFAARINPQFFGKTATVPRGNSGWMRPRDAESVWRIELPEGTEVEILPVEQRNTTLSAAATPAVCQIGQFYIPAREASPPSIGNLVVYYSRYPVKPASMSATIDSSWPDAFNELLSLEVAIYLAMKSDLQAELGHLRAERDSWAGKFAAFLQHETASVRRIWASKYRVQSAAMSVLA